MNQQEGRSAGRWFFSVLEPLVFYLILIILCFTFLLRTTVVVRFLFRRHRRPLRSSKVMKNSSSDSTT